MWYLNKIVFSFTLTLGTLIAASSYTWMGMWFGLEINLLSFIPLITKPSNTFSSESALKYFITQAIASTILLFAVILLSSQLMFFIQNNWSMNAILNMSLLLKMGAAPLHFWFPEVMEGLSWGSNALLLTWQKIAPMILLTYSSKTLSLMLAIVISCMVISGIAGQNQTSLRKIMAYSSINHIGWMIAAAMFLELVWVIYFIIYSIITLNIVVMFNNLNIFFIKQMTLCMNFDPLTKLFFILNFLSLGGLPPFLGFIPKWLTIQTLTENGLISLSVVMIILTLMTLYFYLRITFSSILLSINTIPIHFKSPKNKFFIISSNLVTLASFIFITLAFNYL
uniref:NADH dehydrogenase subunit 2 n=1 Tax=Aegus fukiensis TaxID=617332 RepID=UPI002E7929F0|nr:NADH dehydrogenase subunit 2 [Aegus fukiensis]WQB61562.1 NADH dehydrogenase subunit 2 [Aegus fukiensis]